MSAAQEVKEAAGMSTVIREQERSREQAGNMVEGAAYVGLPDVLV